MIDLRSVKLFQRHSQIGLRAYALTGVEDLQELFQVNGIHCHAKGSTPCLINIRLQVFGDEHVAVSFADLLLVGGLPFRAPTESDLARFGGQHAAVIRFLCFPL